MKRCFGVVVHSEFLCGKVKKSFAGPVTKLFLPHDVTALGTSLTRQQLGLAADRIVILTVGHVNPNKQVESVIRALGNNQDLRGRIHYVLAGPIEPKYREQLMSRAKRSGIEKDLMFVGQVSDEILHAYFRHADFCINLRYPAFESASGSLVEGLLHGKAIIVSDIGFFAEIPDDCVLKIKPQGDEQELGQAIRTLATNTSARNQLQEKAIAFAAQHFYPRRYAEEFLQFLEQARRAKPVLQAVDYVSGELGRMGVTPEMPIAGQAASIIPELFLKNTDNSKG